MKTSKKSSATTSETMRVDDLIPYARNARTHSPEQVGQIAASIREFGFISPIIIDTHNGIIAGHGRLAAAQKLKLDSVPCIRVEHLTETQKRAYILADNKLALNAGWDTDLLKVELATLQEEDFDVLLAGFGEDEMKALLSDMEFTPNLPDEDAPEPIKKYLLTITCEDSEAQESLFRELNEKGFKVEAS